jgi:hypothetical protein
MKSNNFDTKHFFVFSIFTKIIACRGLAGTNKSAEFKLHRARGGWSCSIGTKKKKERKGENEIEFDREFEK